MIKVRNNTSNVIETALRNKICLEEETLALLKQVEVFADDLTEHSEIILMQQRVVNFYKDILVKVSANTNLH